MPIISFATMETRWSVPRLGKIICIGLNYRDHAAESKMPIPEKRVVFSKLSTAVIAPGEPVVLPSTSQKVDYEAELAVVIGRRAKHVKADRAYDYVLGYTALNDVTARDFQFADGQWQRGKSCDTFAPMGQTIVTTDAIPDPHKLSIKLVLNGQTMQDSDGSADRRNLSRNSRKGAKKNAKLKIYFASLRLCGRKLLNRKTSCANCFCYYSL